MNNGHVSTSYQYTSHGGSAPEQFSCYHCGQNLAGSRYILKDEHPYCIRCYEDRFSNTCEECRQKIGTDSKDLSYKDRHWHEKCFFCSMCKTPLVDKPFGCKNNQLFCGECYNQQFASRCDKCNQIFKPGRSFSLSSSSQFEYFSLLQARKNSNIVVNNFMNIVSLVCHVHNQSERKVSFLEIKKVIVFHVMKNILPRNVLIVIRWFLKEVWHTRINHGKKKEKKTWTALTDDIRSVLFFRHRECFTCTNCRNSLAGQRFTSRDEKPFCADCFARLFAKKCFACNKPITGNIFCHWIFFLFNDEHRLLNRFGWYTVHIIRRSSLAQWLFRLSTLSRFTCWPWISHRRTRYSLSGLWQTRAILSTRKS